MSSNTYITHFEFLRGATGQETASLVGNIGYLGGSVTTGVTSLPLLTATTVQLNINDQVYIFDGSNSEIAIVTTVAIAGSTSVSVQPIAFGHASNTPYCSNGTLGSLGMAIFEASANLESITQQALLQATYSETYNLRSMEASITNDWTLSIRPRHFPVTNVTALSMQTDIADVMTLDPTQVVIETRQRLVNLPIVSSIGGNANLLILRPPLDQYSAGFLSMTYTAGFAYSSLPWDIKRACILLTSDVLSLRENPVGADSIAQSRRNATFAIRGDITGESLLYKRAVTLLTPYTRVR